MKIQNIIFAVFMFFFSFAGNSQSLSNENLDKVLKNDPELKDSYARRQRETRMNDSLAYLNNQNKTTSSAIYTIPVVFHVLHLGGPENISDTQIMDQLNILNRDFRKLNADTINIYPPFSAADVKFEFRLAAKDTNGNCTNGTTRHYDFNTIWYSSYNWSTYFQYTWNPSMYLNIYVVKTINGSFNSAYTGFPGTNPGFKDAIVVTSNRVGSLGTSSTDGRMLVREVAHWFNLRRIWGTGPIGTCGDDGISDTPITKGFTTCPSSTIAICNPTISENFQNFMDSSGCGLMFSAGQAAWMTAAINSTISGRNNLWTTSNLSATGVNSAISPCNPICNYYSSSWQPGVYTVCVGATGLFVDNSYNSQITAWQWSASPGIIIASPNSSVTSVAFNTIGVITLNLNVTGPGGSASLTRTFTVFDTLANHTSSYHESFESPGLPPNFTIINPDNDVTWQQTSMAASTGSNSYYIHGNYDGPYRLDILETPSYDFRDNQGATFTFKYAYAKYGSNNTDAFYVLVNSLCNGGWAHIDLGNNSALAAGSGGTMVTTFTPSPGQFKLCDITALPTFSDYVNESNVKFRFVFREDAPSGYGNNIYIDDINFNIPTGINELTRSIGLNVYPNPSNGSGYIEFNLSETSSVEYEIMDVSGRSVEKGNSIDFNTGKQLLEFNAERKLKPGMYIIGLKINNQRISKKFCISD